MHRSLIFILLGTAVVLSLTISSYLVFTSFDPDREMRKMLTAMARVTAFFHDTGFNWPGTTIYASGDVDLSQSDAVSHRTSFRAVRMGEAGEYHDISGELRAVDGKVYMTYTSPAPVFDGVNFNEETTWISFEPGELRTWGALIPEIEPPVDMALTPSVWTPEGIIRLRRLLSVADVFIVSSDVVRETIGDVETRALDAWFDPQALRSFLLGLVRAKEGREPTDEERLASEMRARELERFTLRLWIGVEDHLLYRLQATGPFNARIDLKPGLAQTRFSPSREWIISPTSKLGRLLRFSDLYRTSLSLSKSGLAQTGNSLNSVWTEEARLPVQKVENAQDADGDGLDGVLEAFYGTDSTRADTDGDGMNDGDEIAAGRNPRGKGSLFGFGLD